jgi:hypothetical protein
MVVAKPTGGVIERSWNGMIVFQRESDGYFDATSLCKAGGKRWNNYWRNADTQEFLEELSSVTRIRVTELVQMSRGGSDQGTWVHKRVAIDLARWLSPKLAVKMNEWIEELIEKGEVKLGRGDNVTILPPAPEPMSQLAVSKFQLEQMLVWVQTQEEAERRQSEMRQAIATTHQLATAAMNTASGSHGYMTILGYCNITGRQLSEAEASAHGKKVSALCRKKGVKTSTRRHEKFGTVKIYPESILTEYFGDTPDMFAGFALPESCQ